MPKPTDISSILAIGAALALSACSKPDWREGSETPEQCAERWEESTAKFSKLSDANKNVASTFTYDVTKVPQEALEKLFRYPAGDGKEGGRVTIADGEAAYDAFLKQPVGDAGAFFTSDDLSLVRRKGELAPLTDIVRLGCEGQGEGWRLIKIDFDLQPLEEAGEENEN